MTETITFLDNFPENKFLIRFNSVGFIGIEVENNC